jgi:cob(I)alamin adenosyltransferase
MNKEPEMTSPPCKTPPRKGCIHIYTGNGKGKTTAALGLCLRAVGAGYRVYIGQFLKAGATSESKALERLGDQVTLEQFGSGRFVRGKPSAEDRRRAEAGWHAAQTALAGGRYQMVILDECLVALHQGLLSMAQIQGLIDQRPASVELILTGRHAPPEVMARADLVTDMQEVKHYYRNGIPARAGIEK